MLKLKKPIQSERNESTFHEKKTSSDVFGHDKKHQENKLEVNFKTEWNK